jgi:hypothetical protein
MSPVIKIAPRENNLVVGEEKHDFELSEKGGVSWWIR